MTVREHVIETLQSLDEPELRNVADYVAFLKYQAKRKAVTAIDESRLAALYSEFAEEDSRLAEEGMEDYAEQLRSEDVG